MHGGESISELQAVEQKCIDTIRAKARQLQAEGLSEPAAFLAAVRRSPKAMDSYQRAREMLANLGVPALPIR